MGYAVPGVCFNDGNPNLGFVGWISEYNSLVSSKKTIELNNKYGISPNSFHFRLLKDIRITKSEKVILSSTLRRCDKVFTRDHGCWAINKLLRYVYAIDKFEELTNWRMDHSYPLEKAFAKLSSIIDHPNSINSKYFKARIDGRYFYRKYFLNGDAYNERIKRPIDSEGKPINGYPGVLTKDGLYWFVGNGYMRRTWRAWRKVMIPDDELPFVYGQNSSILQKLPPEVLINVLSHSGDLTNVKLISKHFNSFVNLHRNDIVSRYVSMNFVLKRSLRSNKISDSMVALMRDDDDHISTSDQRRLSQIKKRSSQNARNNTTQDKNDFQTKFNTLFYSTGVFKSLRYTDPHFITLLNENGLDDLSYTIFEDLKIDYLIPEDKIGDFIEVFNEKKNEEDVEFIDKSKFNEFFQNIKIKLPFQNWDSLSRTKLFNSFLILSDLISSELIKFDIVSLELGLFQIFSMSIKLRLIIPCEMINKFITDVVNDNDLEDGIKLSSGRLFVLLHEYQKLLHTQPYSSILEYFYGGHLNSDHHFWIYLRDNSPELIGELLLREDIQPDSHILNDLASSIV